MKIDVNTPIEIDSNSGIKEPDGYGVFSGNQDQPEEKTCKKCLEVESQCECAYYDQLEADELKAIEADKKTRPSDIFGFLGNTQIFMSNLF